MADTRSDLATRASSTAAAIAAGLDAADPEQRDLAHRVGNVCTGLMGLLAGADPDTQLRILAAADGLLDALAVDPTGTDLLLDSDPSDGWG
jgi:hypothetical protein